jgi:hypothetical protein
MRQYSHLACLLSAALIPGCAGGGFSTSLSDEELPVVEEPSPYPTAVAPGNRDIPPAKPAKAAVPVNVQSVPATPLAMVPSPLRIVPHEVAKPAEAVTSSNVSATSPAAGDNLPPIIAAADVRSGHDNDSPSVAAAPESARLPAQPLADPPTASPAVVQPDQFQSSQAPITIVPAPEERLAAIRQQRDVLIAMLEEDIHHRKSATLPTTDPELPRLEQQLRLLYAAAERPDDAARAIDNFSEPEREAYKHLMFGLSTWLADQQSQRGPFRAARVLRSLRDASSELASASKLELRNLAFCERVENFGWFTEFSRLEFLPKQQVILYVEVENFAAQEKGPHSFETELQGHYQIFDARGNIVAERKLPLDRETCRNVRRDYFLAYPIYLPDAIEPGRYRLELTIEDLKATGEYQGRKFGEGTIEFSVRS